jgi:hypothetical protein
MKMLSVRPIARLISFHVRAYAYISEDPALEAYVNAHSHKQRFGNGNGEERLLRGAVINRQTGLVTHAVTLDDSFARDTPLCNLSSLMLPQRRLTPELLADIPQTRHNKETSLNISKLRREYAFIGDRSGYTE